MARPRKANDSSSSYIRRALSQSVDLSGRQHRESAVVLDMDHSRLIGHGRIVRTRRSTALTIARLAQDYGRVVSHADIIRSAFGHPYTASFPSDMRDHMRWVREALVKIGLEAPMECEFGVGYRLMYPIDVIARIPVVLPQSRMGVLLPAMAAGIPLPPQRLEARV